MSAAERFASSEPTVIEGPTLVAAGAGEVPRDGNGRWTKNRSGPKALNDSARFDSDLDLSEGLDVWAGTVTGDLHEKGLPYSVEMDNFDANYGNEPNGYGDDTNVHLAEFTVKDAQGNQVGTMTRQFDENDMTMWADTLYLDESVQGKGIGTTMQESMEDFAFSNGYVRSKVTADEVGRYAWTRAGYDWDPDNRTSLGRLGKHLGRTSQDRRKKGIRDEDFEMADQIERLAGQFNAVGQGRAGDPLPASLPTPYELSNILGPDDFQYAMPMWHGVKPLGTSALAAAGGQSREARLAIERANWEAWWPNHLAAADGADDPEAEAAWAELTGTVIASAEFRREDTPRSYDGKWTKGGSPSGRPIPPPPGRAGGPGPKQRPPGVLPDVKMADVQIAYRPRHPDGHADPGEIVWARIPFEEDPTQSKDRPVLIVGRTKDGKNLVGVQLTSKPGDGSRTSVGTGKWDNTGRESYLKLDRLVQIDDVNYRREGDYVKKDKFQGIVDELTEKQHTAKVQLASRRRFHLARRA